jgi:hypothetical protein
MQDGTAFFCATPLAASLCGGTGAAAADVPGGSLGKGGGASALESSAYIIVETNFRVGKGKADGKQCVLVKRCSVSLHAASCCHTAAHTCWSPTRRFMAATFCGPLFMQVYAHTSNQLQRRVLQRLMRTDCLLPNLYVGTLTRETFMEALEAGLKAKDITMFLQQHAHPQVARRVPTVPEVCTHVPLAFVAVTQRERDLTGENFGALPHTVSLSCAVMPRPRCALCVAECRNAAGAVGK